MLNNYSTVKITNVITNRLLTINIAHELQMNTRTHVLKANMKTSALNTFYHFIHTKIHISTRARICLTRAVYIFIMNKWSISFMFYRLACVINIIWNAQYFNILRIITTCFPVNVFKVSANWKYCLINVDNVIQSERHYCQMQVLMDLQVWPLRSWSNKCTQNEIQSLYLHS